MNLQKFKKEFCTEAIDFETVKGIHDTYDKLETLSIEVWPKDSLETYIRAEID